jgi:PAS domain S-box-containing protein
MVYISPACEEVLGYTPEEFYTDPRLVHNHIHAGDLPARDLALKEILEVGSGTYEYRWRHSDGSLRHIHGSASVVYNADGKPHMLNGIVSDITSLRQAELKAQVYDRRLTEILESITDNFFVMDKEFNFVFLNRHFEQTMQMSRRDLIGKSLWNYFPKEDYGHLMEQYQIAIDENRSVELEVFNPLLQVWFQVYAYPIKEGLAVYFIDVTERKNTQQLIIDQNRKLREIAWIQSHKVRAPLARLMGLVHIINKDNFADPNNEVLLKYLMNEAHDLDEINTEVVRKSYEVTKNMPEDSVTKAA